MKRYSRVVCFGLFALVLISGACGSETENATEEQVPTTPEAAPPDAEAVAAASRLASRLGTELKLVPTIRGVAEIGYTRPEARTEQNFIVTTIRVQNLDDNAIAGFQVDEFWFDVDGNTVTGDRVRFREPVLSGQIMDIELRVPRNPAMDRSNYEFTHQNGDIQATLMESIEAPPEPEEEDETEDAETP